MAHHSEPRFRVLHALRIKGFATSEVLGEIAAVDVPEVESYLGDLRDLDLAVYREARALWQLTPKGREAHTSELAADATAVRPVLEAHYPSFLSLNESFKALCGDWQLRDGAPNDHSDEVYDKSVIERLLDIDAQTQPVVTEIGQEVSRVAPYGPRLTATAQKVADGDHHLFTGVMCGSYHDVWMELHEDFILTLRIDRAREGSF
jgi:hypothetical protein